MKTIWKYGSAKRMRTIAAAICALLFFMGQKSICFADTTGTVAAPSVNVRKSADTNSEVIGSTSQGKTVTITSEVTDASGTLWYEVYVDANTKGYVRADLVNKDGGSETGAQSTDGGGSAPAQTSTASGAESAADVGMDAQYATVKIKSNVRSGPSKTNSIVGKASEGAQVIVSGQSDDSSGETWYYVNFTDSDGQEKTGFIRYDLIDLGELVPVETPPEEMPEEQQPAEQDTPVSSHQGYEAVYEGDAWYLYNYTEAGHATKQNLEQLLEASAVQSANAEIDAGTISKQRIAIIVLIGVIIVLAVIVTIMIFKLKDAYYESDEDEDEDEEEEPVRRKRTSQSSARNTSQGSGRSSSQSSARNTSQGAARSAQRSAVREDRQQPARRRSEASERAMPAREVTYEEGPETQVRQSAKRKAKNFLIDDDDLEFGFLNVNDRDNKR